jgi:hypothetical protein
VKVAFESGRKLCADCVEVGLKSDAVRIQEVR